MENTTQRIHLRQLLTDHTHIYIPDVQRDYVMGSGGKKLKGLLRAMNIAAEKKENFYFSCIVGYKDEDVALHIYDGQQRLVTLVYLCTYLAQNDENYTEERVLLQKFFFGNRETANTWLKVPSTIQKTNAEDFTTYSLAQLVQTYNGSFPNISFDFLFDQVQFDMVLVEKSSDAEQFFFDLNDGLDLDSDEIFKAELYDHIRSTLNEKEFKRFALKAENQWLNFFMQDYNYGEWKQDTSCEERRLVLFWQYCFRMMWIERYGSTEGFDKQKIDWLSFDEIIRLELIMDKICKLDKHYGERYSGIAYSKTQLIGKNRYDSKGFESNSIFSGEHWMLADNNYPLMLHRFIMYISETNETNKDVLMWCYLSNLPYCESSQLQKYLRFVKKLLNQNRLKHKCGSISFVDYGIPSKKLFYTGYYVIGIPSYYMPDGSRRFKDFQESDKFTNTPNPFFYPIILLNKDFISDDDPDFLNIYLKYCDEPDLKKILQNEKEKRESTDNEIIQKLENLPFINGLVDNFVSYKKNACFLAQKEITGFYDAIFELNQNDYYYKDILKFIKKWKVDLQSTLISDIWIQWINYCNTIRGQECAVIPHTWCDLFTSENQIHFSTPETLWFDPDLLPDGWIQNGDAIYQPKDVQNYNRRNYKGFESGQVIDCIHCVWNLKDFIKNFSYIQKSGQNSYLIDGIIYNDLHSYYLRKYNGNNQVDIWINTHGKVYFNPDPRVNEILAKWYSKDSGEELTPNSQSSLMYVREIDGLSFFIEIPQNPNA